MSFVFNNHVSFTLLGIVIRLFFFFKHYYQHGLQLPTWDRVPMGLSESLLSTLSVALASLPSATEVIFTMSGKSQFFIVGQRQTLALFQVIVCEGGVFR